jgi:hypothetical protein
MDSSIAQEWPAISVRQPWAELLISGRKSIEIRSWAPEYRGRLWLHAGLKSDPEVERRFGLHDLYRGGFIGSIELIAIVPITEERWIQWLDKHLDSGEHRGGLVAWMVGAPRRFHAPVPGRGQRNLFYPSAEIVQQLKRNEGGLESGEYDAVS